MADPEGSPTPRKGVKHPRLEDSMTSSFQGLSFVNQVYDPVRGISKTSAQRPKLALPSPHINPDPTEFLTASNSAFAQALDKSTRTSTTFTAANGLFLDDANTIAGSVHNFHNRSSISDDQSSVAESGSTIETSAESAQVTRLRRQLEEAQAKLAEATKGARDSSGSTQHTGLVYSIDTSSRQRPLHISTRLGSASVLNAHNLQPEDDTSVMSKDGLMEGSLPDFEPKPVHNSVVGSSSAFGSLEQQIAAANASKSGLQSFPGGHASFSQQTQDFLRRDSHGSGHKASPVKENMPWGFSQQGIHFDTMGPSPSTSPGISSFPPSLAGSTASLPLVNTSVAGRVPRPQSASLLSPMAPEFSAFPQNSYMHPTPWNTQPRVEPQQTHQAQQAHQPAQPQYTQQSLQSQHSQQNYSYNYNETPNYGKMLERNYDGPYKPFVDRIVYSNDQQASIALQQKLKNGNPEQKALAVKAIIEQARPLMMNRFGNFLIQRCLEHGEPDQVLALCYAIHGHTRVLAMDPFGCHVVQKAFDYAPEEYKAIMVHELLCNIQETVVHRYSCHVWQKLFELDWTGTPPQIMKYVNEALRGMWHEVALGETGSLVVQNIFENCVEEDKRPSINEVLNCIDVIAHGQFGNWCIQHVCEHGAPADRTRAIDHILRFATEYSTDQYASKVVEKCLKICGPEFLDRYLERVCEARADRPRIPLIDIAGDQYGNYLIQYILQNADSHRRELVCSHLRKHMVSLRGSKYGSRVAMYCNNSGGPRSGPSPYYDRPRSSGRDRFHDQPTWGDMRDRRYQRDNTNRETYNNNYEHRSRRPYGRFNKFERSFDNGY